MAAVYGAVEGGVAAFTRERRVAGLLREVARARAATTAAGEGRSTSPAPTAGVCGGDGETASEARRRAEEVLRLEAWLELELGSRVAMEAAVAASAAAALAREAKKGKQAQHASGGCSSRCEGPGGDFAFGNCNDEDDGDFM